VTRIVIRAASLLDSDNALSERAADVAIEGDTVNAVGDVAPLPGDEVVNASGRTLLPGLHDHHLHLLALAAAGESLACGPPAVSEAAEFRTAVSSAEPRADGWIRGVGYHDSVAGPLNSERLDTIRDDVPVRIQDASGAAWYVNSVGVERLGLTDVGRGADGVLLRMDDAVREDAEPPDLAEVGAQFARWGVTGLTDATPDLDATQLDILAHSVAEGSLPQRVTVMSGSAAGLESGPEKILLSDHQLPGFDVLAERISTAHQQGRAVAVHSVTRESLALFVAALDEVGPLQGDRVEHASVTPPELAERLLELGVTVVTQPNFVAERGDRYLTEVQADDQPWLYRCRGLAAAGIPLAAGTDAPFGHPNPWRAIRAAVRRETPTGVVLGVEERLGAAEALNLFLGRSDDPGGPPRRIGVGEPADLCLLAGSWRDLVGVDTDPVLMTICRGQIIHADRSLR